MARIAFLGLGVMGAPMARHLAAAGHELVVHNRSPEKARGLGRAARRHAPPPTPAEAAAGAEAVIACVGADADVEQVTLGPDGAFAAMRAGRPVRRPYHRLGPARAAARRGGAARGLLVVDAPVSGGQAGAEKGKLAIMCGGSDDGGRRGRGR